MKIKKPSVAGQFYDANAEQLAANIESYVVIQGQLLFLTQDTYIRVRLLQNVSDF